MVACENSGHNSSNDFAEVSKIVEAGATSKPKLDYELTRYACYLVVQNGDPRKEVIALGQTYFAIQTYRQEVADHFNELSEDNRRLVVRGDIKQWNQMLAETALYAFDIEPLCMLAIVLDAKKNLESKTVTKGTIFDFNLSSLSLSILI